MGFMDELKKLTRTYNEDDDAEFDDFGDMDGEETASRTPRASRTAPAYNLDDMMDTSTTATPSGNAKVVSLHNGAKMQVVIVKPTRFDEASEIADSLLERKALVLNLENTEKDVARRLVDFLSGCAYAMQGAIKKIAASTYLITPNNVEIIGDLLDELESSGLYS
ncbi:MAG: cell division protein SepF [Eubacteriales bacterium]